MFYEFRPNPLIQLFIFSANEGRLGWSCSLTTEREHIGFVAIGKPPGATTTPDEG